MEDKNFSPFGVEPQLPEQITELDQQTPSQAELEEATQASGNFSPEPAPAMTDNIEIFKLSWKTFKANATFLLILTLIYFAIRMVEGVLQKVPAKNSWESIVVMLAMAALNIWIAIGMIQIYLKISRGSKASYAEMFGGLKYFGRFLGGSILYGLIVLAGYLLLIVPGIIWQYKYSMFSYLIIDKDMKITDAINESGRIMYGFKWKLFFLQLLMLVLVIAGVLLLGIGLLAAIPVVTLMSVTFYRMVSGEKVSD